MWILGGLDSIPFLVLSGTTTFGIDALGTSQLLPARVIDCELAGTSFARAEDKLILLRHNVELISRFGPQADPFDYLVLMS